MPSSKTAPLEGLVDSNLSAPSTVLPVSSEQLGGAQLPLTLVAEGGEVEGPKAQHGSAPLCLAELRARAPWRS